jgi:hypothetical protein
MFYPIIAGIAALSGLYYLYRKETSVPTMPTDPSLLVPVKFMSDDANLIPVQLNGETWLVAPDYIGPIGIGEAAALAASAGMQLPSPALVDAIWRQADLKLLPQPRAQNIVSAAVFADQQARIAKQIDGRPFKLLGGAYKDIVAVNGKPQLYGWHVEDGKSAGTPLHAPVTPGPGKVIQPPSGAAHSLGFKDYSQGLRMVKKAPVQTA